MNDRERIAELETTVERLERDLAQSQLLRRQAVEARDAQSAKLKETREQLKHLRNRRAVRMALGLSRRTQRIITPIKRLVAIPRRTVRAVHRRGRAAKTQGHPRATPGAERDLAAAIRRDLPPATLRNGPLVSIVILNRDGRDHLARCLRAVAMTAYRDIEIIVVDNGSTDGSADFAEGFDLPFPLRVLRNTANRSFSDANDEAAAVATGELLLFLNNDVEPITEGWLGYMVETLTTFDAAAVGARLIYPSHRGAKRAGATFADLTLQHRGVSFDRGQAVPMPRVMGAGEDPRSAAAVAIEERPALTAACLLVNRKAFEGIGGFASDYDYGLEDIDLCLKLRAGGGRLLYDGRAALWHHESATRAADPAVRRSRVARNREAYLDAWGPRVFRAALLDAVDGDDAYSALPFHVAVLGIHDEGPVHALADLGWLVSRPALNAEGAAAIDASADAAIVVDPDLDIRSLPSRLLTLAWIGNEPERWVERPWFDDYDIVLASNQEAGASVRARTSKTAWVVAPELSAASIRGAIVAWATATRYGLRVGAPSRDVAAHWGDYHFARALQRSLERSGHPTRVHFLPDWGSASAARDDVTVHLFGLKEAPTRRGQVNILWQISHPDLASPELYDRYDHVFVASDRFAELMRPRVTVPVTPLHQATDPERFKPDPTGPAHDLLFVGNSRGVRRRIVDDVIATGHELAVYGGDWRPDLLDPRLLKGENIPNDGLNRYYSSAAIVLNDHWNDMAAEGFISNRLYDALACGAFVISDHLSELADEFDQGVVTYVDRVELGSLIDRYLGDPEERRAQAARGRAAVLARHTFDERAGVLREAVESLLPIARGR